MKYLPGIVAAFVLGICALLLFAPEPAQSQEYVRVTTSVSDQANILSPEKEASLTKQLVAFSDKTKRQVAVITIKSLEGRDIQEYATGYFRFLGVGSKEMNDGVLFLISPNDRKMRIEVGYGLEASLTDAASGRILTDIKPYFRAKDYDGGVQYGVDNILSLVTPEALEQAQALAAKEKIRAAKTRESIGNFFEWIGLGLLAIGGSIGAWWAIGIPRRRREAAEAEAARILREAEEAEERKAYLARVAKEQAAQRVIDEKNRIAKEKRDAEERERMRLARLEAEKKARLAQEKKDREWAEYLKNETPAQKTARLAAEEAERLNKIEAERVAALAAVAENERRKAAEKEAAKAREAQRRRDDEEAAERRRRDDDYYRSSSYGSSSSSSSSWGSSSSDWGSSSSSSSDYGGGSSGGGGSSSDW